MCDVHEKQIKNKQIMQETNIAKLTSVSLLPQFTFCFDICLWCLLDELHPSISVKQNANFKLIFQACYHNSVLRSGQQQQQQQQKNNNRFSRNSGNSNGNGNSSSNRQ